LSVCSLANYKIACELIKFSTGSLPSSALTPIFEEVFFVPRRCLQNIRLYNYTHYKYKYKYFISTNSFIILPISVSINLFDKLVIPILTYNSEISFMDYFLLYHRAKQRAILRNGNMDHFTFIDRTLFEKVHLIFCKQEEKLLFFGSVSGCTCLIL
jgi:hypothetical protein